MFSNQKQIWFQMKNGIVGHKKLFLLVIGWSILCVYQGGLDTMYVAQAYGISISTADILIELQDGQDCGLKIFPLIVFLVMKCKVNNLYTQFVVRYEKRDRIIHSQILESLGYATLISLFVVSTETMIAYGKKLPFINWDALDNQFFIMTGEYASESFLKIFILVLLFYIIKFMLVFAVLDLLLWYPKYLFLLWILLILLAAMELPSVSTRGIIGVHSLFSVQYGLWETMWKQGILLIIGALIVMLIYQIGFILIRKTDIYKS